MKQLKCTYFMQKKLEFFTRRIIPKLILCDPARLDCTKIKSRIINWFIDSASMTIADSVAAYTKEIRNKSELEKLHFIIYEIRLAFPEFAQKWIPSIRIQSHRICEFTQNQFHIVIDLQNEHIDYATYPTEEDMLQVYTPINLDTIHRNSSLLKRKFHIASTIAHLLIWTYFLQQYRSNIEIELTNVTLPSETLNYQVYEALEVKYFIATVVFRGLNRKARAKLNQSVIDFTKQVVLSIALSQLYRKLAYTDFVDFKINKSIPMAVDITFGVKRRKSV